MRRIFERYALGSGHREIARTLNQDGIPSSRGNPSWDPSAVRAMLLNPRYIGDWSWNRCRWQKTPEALLSEAERDRIRLTGRHPRRPTRRAAEELVEYRRDDLRIVPQPLWDAVQARFKTQQRTMKGGNGYKRTRSPVAGLLTCTCGGNITTHTSERKGHRYTRLSCARHRNRGPEVCANDTTLRIEAIAEPLLGYVRSFLLDPARIEQAVAMVNRKIEERLRGEVPTAQIEALHAEAAQLEREVQNLVQALAHGTAYEAISAALAAKDGRLRTVRAELDVLTRPAPELASVPRVDAQDVRTRLGALWEDIRKLDGDRARLALAQVFDGITVKPLRGRWENGWTLEMRPRPQVGIPEGAVVSTVGCGGARPVRP